MSKEIQLTQGKVAIVDDDDFEELSKYKWYVNKCRNYYYAMRTVRVNKKKYNVKMHRLIMGLEKGNQLVVDHINHNTLDNRRCNLRQCLQQENTRNQRKQKDRSSIYKGVCVYMYKNRWYISAVIRYNKKNNHLGLFNTELEAAKAYNEAAKKYFGEFALLNEV